MIEPTHLEDCPDCEFVGKLTTPDAIVDLYLCGDGFVARYGEDGDYYSNTSIGGGLRVFGNTFDAILLRKNELVHAD